MQGPDKETNKGTVPSPAATGRVPSPTVTGREQSSTVTGPSAAHTVTGPASTLTVTPAPPPPFFTSEVEMEQGTESWTTTSSKRKKALSTSSSASEPEPSRTDLKKSRIDDARRQQPDDSIQVEQAETSSQQQQQSQTQPQTKPMRTRIAVDNSLVVFITGISDRITKQNPIRVFREIAARFGPATAIESRGASLRIVCENQQQKQAVLTCTTLVDIDVKASLPRAEVRRQDGERTRLQRVVIGGVPLDMDDHSIQQETGAASASRIHKYEAGSKIATKAVILSFDCKAEEVPDRVQLGFLVFKTRTYIPKVTRCYKCQAFGHIAANCRKATDICPICAGQHKMADCTCKEEDGRKCANCGGQHSANSRGCPRYELAVRINKMAATEKISYRDALVRAKKDDRKTVATASAVPRSQPTAVTGPSAVARPSAPTKPSTTKPAAVNAETQTSEADLEPAAESESMLIDEPEDVESESVPIAHVLKLVAIIMQACENKETRRQQLRNMVLEVVADWQGKPEEEMYRTIRAFFDAPTEAKKAGSGKPTPAPRVHRPTPPQTSQTSSTSSTQTAAVEAGNSKQGSRKGKQGKQVKPGRQ